MKIYKKEKKMENTTKVVIKDIRLSYVHVWEKSSMTNDDANAKYSACLIIRKDDAENLAKINKAIEAAKQEGASKKFGGKIPANLKTPLRDADIDRPDDEAMAGCYFINANSKDQPGVLEPTKQRMTEQSHLYSGVYAHVSVNFYAYNSNGNRGIACSLNNIMKTRDGEVLAGKASAESDFGDFDAVVPTVDEDEF